MAALAGHGEEAERIVEALETHRLDLMATAAGSGRVVTLALPTDRSGPLCLRAEGDCAPLGTDLSPRSPTWADVDAVLALPEEAGGGCLLFRGLEALRLGPDLAELARFALTAPVTTVCLVQGSDFGWAGSADRRVIFGTPLGQTGEVTTQEPMVALVALTTAKSPVLGVSATGGLYRLEPAPRPGRGQAGALAPWYRIEPPLNALAALPGSPGQVLVVGARGLALLRGLPALPICVPREVPAAPMCAVRLPPLGDGEPEWLVATRDRGLQFLDGSLEVQRTTHMDDIATALCCADLGSDGPRLYVGCARGNVLALDLLGPQAMAEVRRLGDLARAWSEQWAGLPCAAQLALVRLATVDPAAPPGAEELYTGLDPRIRALVSLDGLLNGIRALQEQGLIQAEGDARYRIGSQGLRRWVAARHPDPFDVVRAHATAIVRAWTLADLARVQETADACGTPHWPGETFQIDPACWGRAAGLAERWSAWDCAEGAGRLARFADYAQALTDLLGATLRGQPEGQDPGPYWCSISLPGIAFQGFDDLRLVAPGALADQDLPAALDRMPIREGRLPRIILLLTRSGPVPHLGASASVAADLAALDGSALAAVALDPNTRQRFLDALIPQIDIAALSPFQTAGPVRETFYGREAERHRIRGYVLRGEGKGCAIIGPRRIGKTSLLLKVKDEVRQDPAVEVQFLDATPYRTDLGALLRAILQKLGVHAGPTDTPGFLAALRDLLRSHPRRRLALFIDEADGLAAPGPSGPSPLLNALRSLTTELGVAVVLAGYRVLYDQMKDIDSALFNMLEPIDLGRLEEPAAIALVADNLRHVYRIDGDLVRDLVSRAGFYPNFIQTACAHLIARKGREGDRTIRRDDIQAVLHSHQLFDHMVRFYLVNLDERTRAVLFLLISLYDPARGVFILSREALEHTLKAGYGSRAHTRLIFDTQFTPYDLHRLLEVHGVSLDPAAMEAILRRLVLASVIAPVPETRAYAFTLPDLPLVLRRHMEVDEEATHYAERLPELFGASGQSAPSKPRSEP